ncbi:MAG: hypothetical protein HY391_05255 [Deltaproteobacteria bacterium]|nr:hypothetical protein [Deltaproteobacteria bacterium]
MKKQVVLLISLVTFFLAGCARGTKPQEEGVKGPEGKNSAALVKREDKKAPEIVSLKYWTGYAENAPDTPVAWKNYNKAQPPLISKYRSTWKEESEIYRPSEKTFALNLPVFEVRLRDLDSSHENLFLKYRFARSAELNETPHWREERRVSLDSVTGEALFRLQLNDRTAESSIQSYVGKSSWALHVIAFDNAGHSSSEAGYAFEVETLAPEIRVAEDAIFDEAAEGSFAGEFESDLFLPLIPLAHLLKSEVDPQERVILLRTIALENASPVPVWFLLEAPGPRLHAEIVLRENRFTPIYAKKLTPQFYAHLEKYRKENGEWVLKKRETAPWILNENDLLSLRFPPSEDPATPEEKILLRLTTALSYSEISSEILSPMKDYWRKNPASPLIQEFLCDSDFRLYTAERLSESSPAPYSWNAREVESFSLPRSIRRELILLPKAQK